MTTDTPPKPRPQCNCPGNQHSGSTGCPLNTKRCPRSGDTKGPAK